MKLSVCESCDCINKVPHLAASSPPEWALKLLAKFRLRVIHKATEKTC